MGSTNSSVTGPILRSRATSWTTCGSARSPQPPDGTGPLTETTLKDLDQPWIMRLGPLTHMPEFYASLDICCLPSHREGFPNVNLEAAATGLSVVTTIATG
jgi:glycosyltransferase involved in cell wall biosynthesis